MCLAHRKGESQRDSRNKTEGCVERATLGNATNGKQLQWGCARLRRPYTTPSGLESIRQETQGCEERATLGWTIQSLWDCPVMKTSCECVFTILLNSLAYCFELVFF